MILKLTFVLVICSVVIASGSSCKNVGNVQNPKYFNFNKGFFYIHGLTNGESVVMYKTPNVKKIHVQYTFINEDCLYETRKYNIIENGKFVDHATFLEKQEEFSFSKTLSFNVEGKDVEIKFKINATGFELVEGIKEIAIQTIKVIKPTFLPQLEYIRIISKDASTFEFPDKDSMELTDMKNGRFFYQNYEDSSIISSYAFKTSSDDYYKMEYSIVNPFQDNPSINLGIESFIFQSKVYEMKNANIFLKRFTFHVKYKGDVRELKYKFDSTGLTITVNTVSGLSSGAIKPAHENSMAF